MSPVDFKKRPCSLSLSLEFPCRFENNPMSLVTILYFFLPCHYFVFLSFDFNRVQCRLSNLRKGCVSLSNLRVNGPEMPR